MLAPQCQKVVHDCYGQSKQQTERAARTHVGDSEPDSDQRKHKTRGRQRQPLMDLGTPFSLFIRRRGVGGENAPGHFFDLSCLAIYPCGFAVLFFGNLEAVYPLIGTGYCIWWLVRIGLLLIFVLGFVAWY